MKLVPAKTIITPTDYAEKWFGVNFNMNIYRGCCHGCIYCDSRSDCYRVDNFSEVAAKENALGIIARELQGKRKKGIVGTGAMSDPYNPREDEHCLTRGALEIIHRFGFGIHLITKGTLVVRDMDILTKINGHSPVGVGITITAADDEVARRIEPGAPTSSQRFAAIQALTANGIYTGILMMPILPFITDSPENITSLVRLAAEYGARYIYPAFGMTMRDGQRDYFYQALDRLYPGLRNRYGTAFGQDYQCPSPDEKILADLFSRACAQYGLVHRMPEIIAGIRASAGQSQLFLDLPVDGPGDFQK